MDSVSLQIAIQKVKTRIIPFLFILYLSAFIDRVNLSFAAASFQKDLSLSNTAYGAGAGIFFLGYFLFEIPSNLILERTGARKWIARIMFTWAIVSAAMMFVKTPVQFFACRFMLGVAEAGFFPGMIFYLTNWFPAEHRARAISKFMLASPLATVVGSPISLAIMKYVPKLASAMQSPWLRNLKGWQWLFMIEAMPSFIFAFVVLVYLTDRIDQAHWLTGPEKEALSFQLAEEKRKAGDRHIHNIWVAFKDPRVWLLTSIYMSMNIGNYGLDFWLPKILKSFHGIDTSKPNIYNMLPYIAAAIGMVWVGNHADKTREVRYHIFIPCAISAAFMLGFAYFQGKSPYGALFCITLAAVGPRAILGPFWTLPPVFLGGSGLAASIAFINSVGNLGGYLGPQALGVLADKTKSNVPGIVVLATAILVTGILGLMVSNHHTHEAEEMAKEPVSA